MTQSTYLKICDKISKIGIYLTVFLLPIFFLPWTGDALDFNKQVLLILLVFISSFAWMLKTLISGRIRIGFSWIHLAIGVLFLAILGSTIFSLYSYGSFWGWPQATSESLLTLISLILFYLVLESEFKKEEVFYLVINLFFSVFLVMLFGALQLFGKFVLYFPFTKTAGFNMIGSASSLAILAAVFLPILTLLIVKIKKNFLLKIFLIINIVLNILVLALVNFSVAWWLVIIGAILTVAVIAQRKDIFDGRWLMLPMLFLAIGLLFIFFNIRIPKISANRPIEISLSQKASLDIAKGSLKSNPVFGSGPGTFAFDFAKYKKADFNNGQLWNIGFNRAGSEFINSLATNGVLGALAFLFLIGSVIFYGIKILFVKKGAKEKRRTPINDEGIGEINEFENATQEFLWVLSTGIFISFLVLTTNYFFYSSNLSLNFFEFLFLASFSALVIHKKEFVLKPSTWPTLVFTFTFTLFFVFGLGIFILETQRCFASNDYQKGIVAWQKNDTEQAIEKLRRAAELSPKVDLYWRRLAQLYVQQAGRTIRDKKLSKKDIHRRVQLYINNAVNSAKMAVDVSPKNVNNWSVRAFIYQQLSGVINGADNWAIKSYESASQLEPLNPYFPTQEGLIYVQQASFLPKDEESKKIMILEKAKKQFGRAIELKPDYAPANFQLAIVYRLEGEQQKAIRRLEAMEKIAPFSTGVAFQLGLIYYQNKDYQKAEKEFRRAIILNPNYSNARYFLGLILDREGKRQKAIDQFEKIKKFNPKNKELKKILRNLWNGRPALQGIVRQSHSLMKHIKTSIPAKTSIPGPSSNSDLLPSQQLELNQSASGKSTTTEATSTLGK